MGNFDFDVRVLVCPQCAAPLQVDPQGGAVQCGYCRQTSMFSPRPSSTTARAPGPDVVSDPARIERLQAQVEQPDVPPPDLAPLFQTPVDPGRLHEIELRAAQFRASPPSDQRDLYLHWLTVGLYNAYAGAQNAMRQRALIETAVELIAAPHRRAVLTGMLARNAARASELDAAWDWVNRMDPASESLVADSAYRLTRAYVATARRSFEDVMMVLGGQIGDVPTAAGDNLMVAMLRANAHERLGRAANGAAQLVAFVQHDPNFGVMFDRIVAANASLHLCTQALAMAKAHG